MFDPTDMHKEIYLARQAFERKIEEIEDDTIYEISERYQISESLARQIWEQSI